MLQTSIAISRHTGRADEYKFVPDFAVVDAPAMESIVSNAESVFNDNDMAFRLWSKLLSLKLVFNFLAISSSIFFDADVSSVAYANSPSVGLYNASASSRSMLTVIRR